MDRDDPQPRQDDPIGLLKPLSQASRKVITVLRNAEALKKSRIHPMAILIAAKVYATGHGVKGSLAWTPVPAINEALDDAFYLSFGNVRATGKPLLFGLDISGSMGSPIAGSPLSCAERTAALALVHANVEDNFINACMVGVPAPDCLRLQSFPLSPISSPTHRAREVAR